MKSRQPGRGISPTKSDAHRNDGYLLIMRSLVGIAVVAIPLLIAPSGHDVFRLPKELAFRAEAILISFSAIAMLLVGTIPWRRHLLREPLVVLVTVSLCWALLTTMFSSNRPLSFDSLIWVFSAAIFTVASFAVSRTMPLTWIDVIFPAAVGNSLLLFAQTAGHFVLFTEEQIRQSNLPRTLYRSALVGNPDDVASYLLVPALAAAALLIVHQQPRRRIIYATLSLILGVALLAASSLTAIVAYAAGIATLVMLAAQRGLKRVAIVSACAAALLLAASIAYSPIASRIRPRFSATVEVFRTRGIDARSLNTLSSNRLTAMVAAPRMFMDNPLTGVGIGCFGWQYYRYKIEVERDYPLLLRSPGSFSNFGEVHSDHLQILAVAGAPGYLLFLTALFLVGRLSARSDASDASSHYGQDARRAFSSIFGLPLSVAFGVLALSQFPLELAASTVTSLFAAAVTLAWQRP